MFEIVAKESILIFKVLYEMVSQNKNPWISERHLIPSYNANEKNNCSFNLILLYNQTLHNILSTNNITNIINIYKDDETNVKVLATISNDLQITLFYLRKEIFF